MGNAEQYISSCWLLLSNLHRNPPCIQEVDGEGISISMLYYLFINTWKFILFSFNCLDLMEYTLVIQSCVHWAVLKWVVNSSISLNTVFNVCLPNLLYCACLRGAVCYLSPGRHWILTKLDNRHFYHLSVVHVCTLYFPFKADVITVVWLD